MRKSHFSHGMMNLQYLILMLFLIQIMENGLNELVFEQCINLLKSNKKAPPLRDFFNP